MWKAIGYTAAALTLYAAYRAYPGLRRYFGNDEAFGAQCGRGGSEVACVVASDGVAEAPTRESR